MVMVGQAMISFFPHKWSAGVPADATTIQTLAYELLVSDIAGIADTVCSSVGTWYPDKIQHNTIFVCFIDVALYATETIQV